MSIKGINPEISIPYILECERGETKDQSVFWIRPRNNKRTNESSQLYLNSRIEKRGQTNIDPKKATEADKREFINTIEKVENYIYSSQFPDYHNEDGTEKLWKEITDRRMIEDMSLDLPIEIFNELIGVSTEISKLREGEKKR